VPAPDRRTTEVAARLAAAGCIAAEEEAAAMLSACPSPPVLESWLARRSDGEPLAWIIGTCPFAGVTVAVAPGVYVPRPQTAELARRAAAVLPPGGRLVDLCCGSGAVAVAVRSLVPSARVVGIDLSAVAVRCATTNGVPAVRADVGAVPLRPASVDVVVAVAPYVPTEALALLPSDVQRHEPRVALDGGTDGLALVRAVVSAAAGLVRPGGALLLELGGDQADALALDGFTATETWYDEEGDLRGLITRREAP
jgi:release factor glutamine methyltransferase